MTVLINERPVTAELQAFIDQVVAEAEAAFTVFRETNTITANGTVGFIERVPGAKGQPHTIVQGGGHFLQEDAPEELVRIILDHINRG